MTLKRGFAFVRVMAATAAAVIKCLDQAPFGPTRRRLRVTLARAPAASAKRKHAGCGLALWRLSPDGRSFVACIGIASG